MDIFIGLLIIAVGSFGQSSSYVPINRVRGWSWENFWLVQGIFAWLVFPFLGAMAAIPEGSSLLALLGEGGALKAVVYGALWGIGGLTFGLSMRYLGVALGQSISLGTCSAFGTLLPALFAGTDLLHGAGLILLIGVCITLAGIVVIGYAGSLRSRSMTDDEKRAAIRDFALTKGLLVALLAGVMSACFALGLDAGMPIREAAAAQGVDPLYAGLPVILLVTVGGFVTNAAYCVFQNVRNRTAGEYLRVKGATLVNNLFFCALAGLLWYSQFFGLEAGKSFLAGSPVLVAFSWSILMSLNVIFSNLWGILLKEWRGGPASARWRHSPRDLSYCFSRYFSHLCSNKPQFMKSILENRPELARRVAEVAEVAGYLWQKGWAERNGGNITINVSDCVDDAIRALPPISAPIPFGMTLPRLKGCYFFCKGTNRRMRDLARRPMENGAVIRILDDGASYEIVADNPVRPTSELASHLAMHEQMIASGNGYTAAIHTHPIDLVAMSHHPAFLEKDVLTNLLWSMIPETRAFCPKGLGIVPYAMPSSVELARATIEQLKEYDVVMWEKHGVCAVGPDVMEAFDQIDVLSKSAQIYLTAKAMGFEPTGTTPEQMDELKRAFNL